MIYVMLVAGLVLAPFMVVGGWARRRSVDFGPFFSYAASCSGSRRSSPPSTSPVARSSTRPSHWRRTATSSRSKAWRSPWPRSAAAGPPGTRPDDGLGAGGRRGRRRAGRPTSVGVVHASWAAGRDRLLAVRDALDAAGRRRPTGSCRSTRRRRATGPAAAASSSSTTRSQRSARSPTAYDIRWLVLDAGRSTVDADPRRRPAGVARRADPRGRRPDRLGVYPVTRDGRMTRREAILSALGIFVVALAAASYFAAQIVFPKPEDTAYYVGVARNLLEGRGLVSDALWSYGTPPLGFPARRSRSGCRCRHSSPRSRWPSPGRPSPPPRSSSSSSVRSSRSWPGGWRRTSRRSVACRAGGPAPWPSAAGLTTAVYLPLLLHSSLPDSTMPFTVLALAACLLMTRILRARGAPGCPTRACSPSAC